MRKHHWPAGSTIGIIWSRRSLESTQGHKQIMIVKSDIEKETASLANQGSCHLCHELGACNSRACHSPMSRALPEY
jgi:hypothetical protein